MTSPLSRSTQYINSERHYLWLFKIVIPKPFQSSPSLVHVSCWLVSSSFPFCIACGQAIITCVSSPVRKFEVLSNASLREVSMLFWHTSHRLVSILPVQEETLALLRWYWGPAHTLRFQCCWTNILYPHSNWSSFFRHKSTENRLVTWPILKKTDSRHSVEHLSNANSLYFRRRLHRRSRDFRWWSPI